MSDFPKNSFKMSVSDSCTSKTGNRTLKHTVPLLM